MQTDKPTKYDNWKVLTDKRAIDYWFYERCEVSVNSSITVQELYDDYINYCQNRQITALRVREFTKEFHISVALCTQMRVDKRRGSKGMYFIGVRLVEEGALTPTDTALIYAESSEI